MAGAELTPGAMAVEQQRQRLPLPQPPLCLSFLPLQAALGRSGGGSIPPSHS